MLWETGLSTRRKIKIPKDFFLRKEASYCRLSQEPKIGKLFCSLTKTVTNFLKSRHTVLRSDLSIEQSLQQNAFKGGERKYIHFLLPWIWFQFRIVLRPSIRCDIMLERCARNIILKNIFTDFLNRNVIKHCINKTSHFLKLKFKAEPLILNSLPRRQKDKTWWKAERRFGLKYCTFYRIMFPYV